MKQLSFKVILIFLVAHVTCVISISTYDFIVVGAGAGGGAVTARLAENGKFNVLLLESGGVPKEGQDVPSNAARFVRDPDVTMIYNSIPQPSAALRTNGVVSVVAGRVMGGTTTINTMWLNRGHPKDWDLWAKVTGDESWKYDNMLKYFRRSEDYGGDFPSSQHGYGGPISVTRERYSPGLDYWLAAGRELGYPVGDSNGPQQNGFSPVEFTKRNGRRVSSFIGYISPILETHRNLKILLNATATQILFEGNRATGVRFTSNSTSGTTSESVVYATKEIIVSAGAYSSPILLQRSGIGPRDVLSAAKISIVKELPTGLNLQNHPALNLNFIINNANVVLDEGRDLTPKTLKFYNTFGDGPFANSKGATGQAFLSSSIAAAEGNFDWPDFQLCMSHSTLPHLTYDNLHTTVVYNASAGEVPMSSSIFLGRIKSRGSIKVNPDNPKSGAPVLDMGYFTDMSDIQIFLDAISETLRIFEQTNTYKELEARYAPVTLPECEQFPMRSVSYWICYIMQTASSGCHGGGTNKMGMPNDPTAVVDSKLRVIGVEGLRVVDGSIMPQITNANPSGAIYAIAEKAAEMILDHWEKEKFRGQSPHANLHHLLGVTDSPLSPYQILGVTDSPLSPYQTLGVTDSHLPFSKDLITNWASFHRNLSHPLGFSETDHMKQWFQHRFRKVYELA